MARNYSYITDKTNEDRPIQVESAKRDGSGKNIENNYAKQDGNYDKLFAANLQSSVYFNDVAVWSNVQSSGKNTRTTCETDSTIDGTAVIRAIRGRKQVSSGSVIGATLTGIGSTGNNLMTASGYVVIPDNDSHEMRISGTFTSVILVDSSSATTGTTLSVSTKTYTNPMGDNVNYTSFTIPSGSLGKYIYINGFSADTMVMFVWSGYNTDMDYVAYAENSVSITAPASYFASGMYDIKVGGETVMYDEITSDGTNSYVYSRVGYVEATTSNVSSTGTASGSYYYYDITISGGVSGGYVEMVSDSNVDCGLTFTTAATNTAETFYMSSATKVRVYLSEAHAKETVYTSVSEYTEGTTYYYLDNGSYVEDTTVTDSTTFASELETQGALYTATVNDVGRAYIIANFPHIFYQKSTHNSPTTLSGVVYSYPEYDFGMEWITYSNGTLVPTLVIDYPLNIKATVQTLPKNFVSKDSAEQLLHEVGDLQGFDFDSISYDSDSGKMSINNLVDTKETIVEFDTVVSAGHNVTINSSALNKIYYIPSLDALYFCVCLNLTTTRYGFQPSLVLGSKVSEFFGGGNRNYNTSGIIGYVDTSVFPCKFDRYSGNTWRIRLGTTSNYTNQDFVFMGLVKKN